MEETTQIVESLWLSRPSIEVAPDLVGCTLVRQMPKGYIIRGLIVETEAYAPGDPACHAYRRRTPRNWVMFGPAGVIYVCLVYGTYHCLNIVTDLDEIPSAVLIRAVELESLPDWIDCRKEPRPHRIAAGPGKLCRTLQIDLNLTGQTLESGKSLWLEHRTPQFQTELNHQTRNLVQTTRIGLTRGTDLPWRWYLNDCRTVSKR